MNSKEELIQRLYDIGAIKEGSFKLKSGITSPIYIDLRMIISYPDVYQSMVDLLWEKMDSLSFDHVGGVPYTALPLASGIALLYQKPMLMTRKEVKDHGIVRPVEGAYNKEETVMLIEDLVTSGASTLEVIEKFRGAGLKVTDVVVFLDRQQGGKKRLEKEGVTLHAVCELSTILEVLFNEGKIDGDAVNKIKSFINEHQF
jgi:orotate phosphoribosyltransferase